MYYNETVTFAFTLPDAQTVLYCLLAGILPALLWLAFWLHDDPHPEPRKRLFLAFLGGMVAVPLVVPFENLTRSALGTGIATVIIWAVIEELFKFGAALFTSLRSKDDNSPLEPVIYLLTTALGFAAVENALFIFTPLSVGHLASGIDTGNLRFIGATLIHLVCSASIGVAMGLAFYKSKRSKWLHLAVGLGVAVALHSVFNFFIINSTPTSALLTLYGVWLAVILLGLFFEKLKRVHEEA